MYLPVPGSQDREGQDTVELGLILAGTCLSAPLPHKEWWSNESHPCSELQELIEVGHAGGHFQGTFTLCLLEGIQPVGEQTLQRASKLGWEI